jgi:hypothetical protein
MVAVPSYKRIAENLSPNSVVLGAPTGVAPPISQHRVGAGSRCEDERSHRCNWQIWRTRHGSARNADADGCAPQLYLFQQLAAAGLLYSLVTDAE